MNKKRAHISKNNMPKMCCVMGNYVCIRGYGMQICVRRNSNKNAGDFSQGLFKTNKQTPTNSLTDVGMWRTEPKIRKSRNTEKLKLTDLSIPIY